MSHGVDDLEKAVDRIDAATDRLIAQRDEALALLREMFENSAHVRCGVCDYGDYGFSTPHSLGCRVRSALIMGGVKL